MDPAGFEWTMTLAAGREQDSVGGHDSLYARCSGLSRQSLWLGQIGPPPVCNKFHVMWIAVREVQIAMEKRTFDRKAVCRDRTWLIAILRSDVVNVPRSS